MFCSSPTGANYLVRFLQLNTVLTSDSNGYDSVFGEPNVVQESSNDKIGKPKRIDNQYDLMCQVDTINISDRLRQTQQGKSRGARYEFTVSRRELQLNGLIDVNGESGIRTGARVEKVTNRGGDTLMLFKDPPGLYVEEIIYDSWMNAAFGLCVFVCSPRERAF